MSKLIDALERLVFGATAQERIDMMIELAARRAEARLVAEIETDGPAYDEVYDRTYTDALAHGLSDDEAHAQAARVADEWKAAWNAARVRGSKEATR